MLMVIMLTIVDDHTSLFQPSQQNQIKQPKLIQIQKSQNRIKLSAKKHSKKDPT